MAYMSAMTHETLLDAYAHLTVRSGLNLQKGQELVVTAPLDSVPLVRRITEHAYKAGASLVTTFYSDDATALARFQHAPDAAFDVAPGWLFNGIAEAFKGGAARLAIAGEDPALLSAQDPKKVARASKARSIAYRPALELITGFAINWCVIAAATPAWAKSVFPGEPEKEAVDKLWKAIFSCTRADLPDPATRRWVASRKAAVVKAVIYGLITEADARERYALSEEEFALWRDAVEKYGETGLKVTQIQKRKQL